MDHLRHPHLFSHEWIELHPDLVAKFKRHSVPSGMAALLAIGALSMVNLGADLNMPLKMSEVVDTATGKNSVPTVTTGYYLPEQFVEQEKQARIEELPPQF